MRACVVIPAYNEAASIAGVVSRVKSYVGDIIVIDDCSLDNTAQAAGESGARVLRNEVNLGKGGCISKGLSLALAEGFDAALLMDADGQHLADDLPAFLRQAESSGAQLIVGNRMGDVGRMPLTRRLTNRFMSWMISLASGQKVPDTQCGFRMVRGELLKRLKLTTSRFEGDSEMIIQASRLGFKIDSVPVRSVYAGQASRINPVTDTLRFFGFMARHIFR
jgi:glycosyltransferase involved in cell wall biosynthesis